MRLRSLYFRSRLFRALANLAYRVSKPARKMQIGHFVSMQEEDAFGPMQREEALLLFAVVRVTRPRTLIEFGFSGGRSAFNFLQAMPPESRLYSYDTNDGSARIAKEYFTRDPRFRFLHKSQTEFNAGDIQSAPVDFVLFDGAHNLELNMQAFERIRPALSPGAIVAVHDTGLWARAHITATQQKVIELWGGSWIEPDLFQANTPKEEREFVNWVKSAHPEWQAMHFHSVNCLRYGITMLQRGSLLQIKG